MRCPRAGSAMSGPRARQGLRARTPNLASAIAAAGASAAKDLEVVAGPLPQAPAMTGSDRAARCSRKELGAAASRTTRTLRCEPFRRAPLDNRLGRRGARQRCRSAPSIRRQRPGARAPRRPISFRSSWRVRGVGRDDLCPLPLRPRGGAADARGRPRAQAKPSTRVEPCVLDRGGSSSPRNLPPKS
jgi:hypothetical protein